MYEQFINNSNSTFLAGPHHGPKKMMEFTTTCNGVACRFECSGAQQSDIAALRINITIVFVKYSSPRRV